MNTTGNLKILFLLIKSRLNSDGDAPIYCKLTLNNTNQRFAIGYFTPLNLWSQQKQAVTGKSLLAQNANAKIQEIKTKIQSIEAELIRGQQEYTLQDIINKLQNKEYTPFKTLIQAYTYKYQQQVQLQGKDYKKSTLEKAMQMQRVVEEYLKGELGTKDIILSKVNIQFLTEFENYLKGKRNMALSYSNKNIQKLKSIMKMAFEFGVIDKPAFPNHKFKHENPR